MAWEVSEEGASIGGTACWKTWEVRSPALRVPINIVDEISKYGQKICNLKNRAFFNKARIKNPRI